MEGSTGILEEMVTGISFLFFAILPILDSLRILLEVERVEEEEEREVGMVETVVE